MFLLTNCLIFLILRLWSVYADKETIVGIGECDDHQFSNCSKSCQRKSSAPANKHACCDKECNCIIVGKDNTSACADFDDDDNTSSQSDAKEEKSRKDEDHEKSHEDSNEESAKSTRSVNVTKTYLDSPTRRNMQGENNTDTQVVRSTINQESAEKTTSYKNLWSTEMVTQNFTKSWPYERSQINTTFETKFFTTYILNVTGQPETTLINNQNQKINNSATAFLHNSTTDFTTTEQEQALETSSSASTPKDYNTNNDTTTSKTFGSSDTETTVPEAYSTQIVSNKSIAIATNFQTVQPTFNLQTTETTDQQNTDKYETSVTLITSQTTPLKDFNQNIVTSSTEKKDSQSIDTTQIILTDVTGKTSENTEVITSLGTITDEAVQYPTEVDTTYIATITPLATSNCESVTESTIAATQPSDEPNILDTTSALLTTSDPQLQSSIAATVSAAESSISSIKITVSTSLASLQSTDTEPLEIFTSSDNSIETEETPSENKSTYFETSAETTIKTNLLTVPSTIKHRRSTKTTKTTPNVILSKKSEEGTVLSSTDTSEVNFVSSNQILQSTTKQSLTNIDQSEKFTNDYQTNLSTEIGLATKYLQTENSVKTTSNVLTPNQEKTLSSREASFLMLPELKSTLSSFTSGSPTAAKITLPQTTAFENTTVASEKSSSSIKPSVTSFISTTLSRTFSSSTEKPRSALKNRYTKYHTSKKFLTSLLVSPIFINTTPDMTGSKTKSTFGTFRPSLTSEEHHTVYQSSKQSPATKNTSLITTETGLSVSTQTQTIGTQKLSQTEKTSQTAFQKFSTRSNSRKLNNITISMSDQNKSTHLRNRQSKMTTSHVIQKSVKPTVTTSTNSNRSSLATVASKTKSLELTGSTLFATNDSVAADGKETIPSPSDSDPLFSLPDAKPTNLSDKIAKFFKDHAWMALVIGAALALGIGIIACTNWAVCMHPPPLEKLIFL